MRNHLNVLLPLSILAVVLVCVGEITDGSIYQGHSRLDSKLHWNGNKSKQCLGQGLTR